MSALLIMRLFQEEGSVKEVLDNGLTYEKIVTASTENCEEYYYKIRNNTDSDIFLDKFVMFECDSLESLGLHKDSRLFRSGRHKNDMPGIWTSPFVAHETSGVWTSHH